MKLQNIVKSKRFDFIKHFMSMFETIRHTDKDEQPTKQQTDQTEEEFEAEGTVDFSRTLDDDSDQSPRNKKKKTMTAAQIITQRTLKLNPIIERKKLQNMLATNEEMATFMAQHELMIQ